MEIKLSIYSDAELKAFGVYCETVQKLREEEAKQRNEQYTAQLSEQKKWVEQLVEKAGNLPKEVIEKIVRENHVAGYGNIVSGSAINPPPLSTCFGTPTATPPEEAAA